MRAWPRNAPGIDDDLLTAASAPARAAASGQHPARAAATPALPRRAHAGHSGRGRAARRRSRRNRSATSCRIGTCRASWCSRRRRCASGCPRALARDRIRLPGRGARGVLGHPQRESVEHAHRPSRRRRSTQMTGDVAARPGARRAAGAGDDALGPLAEVAGFAGQGAVRRCLGERGAAAPAPDHPAARPADARQLRRADLAAPADRRRGRRSHRGAQGQSLPALPLPADARVGDRPGPVAPAQPDRGDGRLERAAGGDRGGGRAARRDAGRGRGAGAPSSRGRSRPTSAIRSSAPASSLLARLWRRLYDEVEVHHGERARQGSRRARGSSTCPTTAATSTTCCCRTSSTRRASRRPTSPPAPT